MGTLLARKKSVVVIKNRNQLCCARAIVTMKAWVYHGSRHPDYLKLRKDRAIQEKKAKELRSIADEPEGPCGLKELQKFQDALTGYQIKLLAVFKPHSFIFCGKTPSHKRILLMKVDDHYHDCNSMGDSCRDLTSAMTAIEGTIPKTLTIIRVMDNSIGPMSVLIAPTSEPSNWPWNLVRFLVSGNLKFVDSLCCLPFNLSSFPVTFGLTEIRKVFFSHLFNTLENQDYESPMPPAEMYDPEGMSAKKKEEIEQWYIEKVYINYACNLPREMKAYCESDVKLLKAGCLKFQAVFEGHVTITSACNRFWRKKILPKNTIAVEPPRGCGARTNQSVKAFKRLAWQKVSFESECSHFFYRASS